VSFQCIGISADPEAGNAVFADGVGLGFAPNLFDNALRAFPGAHRMEPRL